MCCHYLSGDSCEDRLGGGNECQSPFGTYELTIPKDDQLICSTGGAQITDKNCKDFDVSLRILNILITILLFNFFINGFFPSFLWFTLDEVLSSGKLTNGDKLLLNTHPIINQVPQ